MSTALQQFKFRSEHRQQRPREIQGHGWVVILSWLGALLCWGIFVVGCVQTLLLCCPTYSVRSGVTAMITEAPYSDLRPAVASVNSRPERASHSPERWVIHRPDRSFSLYFVNWEIRPTADFQPSITRISELTDPQAMTVLSFTQSANKGSSFLEWLCQ
jgi:hypothetical protein